MSQTNSLSVRNEELARQINEEARTNTQSAFAGKFVGIARGQIVGTADSLDELIDRLRPIESDMNEVLCFEAGLDYDQVQEIWRLA